MKAKEPATPSREFESLIRGLSHRHQTWKVFSDFCEMTAISFSNSVAKDDEREKRYLEIVKAYTKEELAEFPKMMAQVVFGLEEGECDFLGEAFMRLGLGSHWTGQFFTPWHICKLMAKISAGTGWGDEEFKTLLEPACGAGAMVLAFCASLREDGINYQQRLHVTAIDVDPTAAHMCYIQLSLMHVPAIVYIGDTLSMEMRSAWFTPAHHLGMWTFKLKRHRDSQVKAPPASDLPPSSPPEPATSKKPGQMDFHFTVGK